MNRRKSVFFVHSIPENNHMKFIIYSAFFLFSTYLLIQCSDSNSSKKNTLEKKERPDQIKSSDEKEEQKIPIDFQWKTFKKKKSVCFDPVKDDDDAAEFCSFREIEIGEFNMTNKQVEKRMNDVIRKAAIGTDKRVPSVNEWLKEITTLEAKQEAFTETVTCQLLERGSNHCVVSVSNDSYYYGAAHPSMNLQILNFDLETGALIKLSDLFKPGFTEALKNIAEKQFIKQNGAEFWNFTPGNGDFELAKEFSITSKGLIFSYNQYEIGPYAAGMPEVVLSYSMLKHLFSENSYLLHFN